MVWKTITNVAKNVAKNTLGTGVFNRAAERLFGAGITSSYKLRGQAKWTGRKDDVDWRVKLQLPQQGPLFKEIFDSGNYPHQHQLTPLQEERGFHWPVTPSMIVQHSANYNALSQTHSNYPFQAYQNSQVDQMNIIGEFPVQNQDDAAYWVATVNFLRTVTKMFFGNDKSDLKGNPPPILHLSGYGDHMFKNVPVVVNTFNVELRAGIDYISTSQKSPYREQRTNPNFDPFNPDTMDQTWAPTLSNISVLVTPIYSRDSLKQFSLKEFARGDMVIGGKQGDTKIGFI